MRTSLNLKIMTFAVCVVLALFIGGCHGQMGTADSDMTDGGIRLLLQVDTDEAIHQELDRGAQSISNYLKSRDIAFDSSGRGDGFLIEVRGVDTVGEAAVRDYLDNSYGQSYEIRSRIAGGKTDFTLSLRESDIPTIRASTIRQTMETLRKRVDAFGVSNPDLRIYTEGGKDNQDRIFLELPGVDDPERAKKLIKNTAQFQLFLVKKSGGGPHTSIEAASEANSDALDEYRILDFVLWNSTGSVPAQYMVVHKDPVITGSDLRRARVVTDANGSPAVGFFLKPEAADLFAEVTGEHKGERLAIVLDNQIHSAPIINDSIRGEGLITGRFTMEEAGDLALLLNSGALPASVQLLELRHVPPSGDPSSDESLFDDPFSGTWVLNPSKSKFPSQSPAPKSQIIHVVVDAPDIEITLETIYESGTRSNIHFDAKLNGKDYPITGNPGVDTIAIQRVDKNTFKATVKKDGRVLLNETTVISPDGRSLTVVNDYLMDTTENPEAVMAVFDKK